MTFSENEKKFFIDMYSHGNNGFDYDIQFFYYYVLFNFLYNLYDDKINPRTSKTERRRKNEEQKIKAFISHVVQSDAKIFSNYNPFAQLNTYKQTELIKRTKEKVGTVQFNYSEKSSEKSLKALFIEIYKVRCDTFHGSENFTEHEPRKLIEECNEVFSRFFDFYFQSFLITSPNTSKEGDSK